MNKYLLGLLMILFLPIVQAMEPPTKPSDQGRECLRMLIGQCEVRCSGSKDPNCFESCKADAEDECILN